MLNRNHSQQEYIGFYIEVLKAKKKDMPTILELYSCCLSLDNKEKIEVF
jgi:hypothetical protein